MCPPPSTLASYHGGFFPQSKDSFPPRRKEPIFKKQEPLVVFANWFLEFASWFLLGMSLQFFPQKRISERVHERQLLIVRGASVAAFDVLIEQNVVAHL